eukprot:scaffold3424_cov111-Skeletonema_dohrnii-CCMP3373.AAC.3
MVSSYYWLTLTNHCPRLASRGASEKARVQHNYQHLLPTPKYDRLGGGALVDGGHASTDLASSDKKFK